MHLPIFYLIYDFNTKVKALCLNYFLYYTYKFQKTRDNYDNFVYTSCCAYYE